MACVVWAGLASDINLGQSPKMLQIASHKSVGFWKVLIFIIRCRKTSSNRRRTEVILPHVCQLSKLMLWRPEIWQLTTLWHSNIPRVGCCCLAEWWLVVVGCVQWISEAEREARPCGEREGDSPQSTVHTVQCQTAQLRWLRSSVIPTGWASLVSVITVGVSTTATPLTTRTNTPTSSTTPHSRSEIRL